MTKIYFLGTKDDLRDFCSLSNSGDALSPSTNRRAGPNIVKRTAGVLNRRHIASHRIELSVPINPRTGDETCSRPVHAGASHSPCSGIDEDEGADGIRIVANDLRLVP